MPFYEYRCDDCQHEFELFQRITAPAGGTCPQCSSQNVHRLISLTSFQLKGSGWYVTDYARGSSKGASKNGSGSSATNGTNGTADKKNGAADKATDTSSKPASSTTGDSSSTTTTSKPSA